MEQPDVLISMLNHSNVIATLSKILSRSPSKLVLVEHSDLSETVKRNNSFSTQLIKIFMRIFYPFADQIVCVSTGVMNSLVREIGINKNKIRVIYNPVVTDYRVNTFSNKDKKQYKNPGYQIVAAGRLTRAKGFSTLIKAFSLIDNQIPCSLTILGEGELRDDLELQIQELHLENRVTLQGYVADPSEWFEQADLFVLSSIWEGLPNVLIEAMACGVQVVSTDCPSGPSEILEKGKWGQLCPPNSPELLAATIENALLNPNTFDVKHRAKAFSVNKSIDQYVRLIHSLLLISDRK
jgi:glycosyltransferase involved in cell wall biosynthesis